MIASIETGYLVNPRIIESTPIITEPLPIKEETRHFLQKAMHAVVTKGSACRLDRLHQKEFLIYAKTSTAQTSSLDRINDGKEFLEHSWLASNFRYKNGAPLTLIIITEYTGRTGIPTRMAYSFLKEYKNLVDAQEQNQKN
jgi:cell division protein FtsI/penicillin-binding protein 2